MSRYSRCPHQNASGTATLAPLHQPQLRNPWVAADRAGESQSTNSSSSSRTYRGPGVGGGGGGGGGPGPPPPLWHAPPPPLPADHFNHHPIATHPRAAHYLVDHQLEVLDGPGAAHAATHLLAPPGPGRPPPHAAPPQPYAASSRAASERDRPVTPASSPGGASGSAGGGAGGGGAAAVDGCGGHCVAFENFCYRLLQVIFIAGILTGISLTIAGSVLRHAPSRTLSPSPSSSSNGLGGAEGGVGGGGGRDKAVLVYIGCLVGLVCALLLAVQCCVRRNVKRRKRALRMSMAAAAAGRRGLAHAHAHAHASAGTLPHPHAHVHAHPHAHATLPGAQQGPVHLAHGGDIPLQELQYQPLLVRLVQQQATASSSSSGNQRLAAASAPGPAPAHAHAPAHYHRPGHAAPAAYREDMEDLDASCSGTPWWRRRGDPRHTRQPHVADTRR